MSRIRVKLKSTGQTGTIEEKDFNPTMFERVGETPPKQNKLQEYVYSDKKAPFSEGLQKEGGLKGFIGTATAPLESGLRYMAGSGIALGKTLGGKGSEVASPQTNLPFLTPQQEDVVRTGTGGEASMQGLKIGSGLSSYATPVGRGKEALLSGFLRGSTAKASEDGATPLEVASSGLSGAVVESVVSKLFPYFQKRGKELLSRSTLKNLGKPSISEGGVPAPDEWSKLGFSTDSLEGLEKSANEYTSKNSGKIMEMAKGLSEKGTVVTKDDVMSYLNKELEEAATEETKRPIRSVINKMNKTFGERAGVPLDEFYNMKKDWGQLGRWSEVSPPKDQQVAKVYNRLYIKANEIMEQRFQESLPPEHAEVFSELNKKLSAAYDIKHFTNRVKLVYMPEGLPAGFNSTLGAILDNPSFLKTLGNVYSGVGNIPMQSAITGTTTIGASNKGVDLEKFLKGEQ